MTLESKFQTYLSLIKTRQDANGFIMSDTCDSLLFTSLVGCVQGIGVNIDAALDYDGNWQRRPGICGTCVSDGWARGLGRRLLDALKVLVRYPLDEFGSNAAERDAAVAAEFTRGNSTISRDMLTGLAWYAWHNKRLDIAEGVVKHALRHFGRMGEGDPTKTNIMPGLLATFAWISYKLGGPSRAWLRWIPADLGSDVVDYQAHLQVLHVLLRAQVSGKPVSKYATILKYQASREPQNALFVYAAALANVWSPGTPSLLANTQWWPEMRLPTTADRSEPWLFQRDYGLDWTPAGGDVTPVVHTGGDFLFLYAMMTGRLK